MPRVAIVIVTYHSAAEIAGCLDSLAGLPETEIVVVDNASTDGTPAEANRPGTRLIANSRNLGFAGAVNQGVRATSAPFVLLLNPDAQLQHGLSALIAQFEDPFTGAAGGRLTGPDGQAQTGFMARNLPTPAALIFELLGINRLWPRNRVNWHYRCLGLNPSAAADVEQPAGAFLMFSRSAYEKVGGFDERFYPVWFEDVDFCAQLKEAGYRVRYTPEAVANHTGGHSIDTLPMEIRQRYWYGSLLEYAAKRYSPLAFRAVCFAVALGAGLRAVPALLRTIAGSGEVARGVNVVVVYGSVARIAFRRLFRKKPGN
jgi:N-acetylglucosaminyl-diphospho-decaprenol L-rhamnosyltransferase